MESGFITKGGFIHTLNIVRILIYMCKDLPNIFFAFCVGSMPPNSRFLWEEGMCVKSFKLVQNGIFQEDSKLTANEKNDETVLCIIV